MITLGIDVASQPKGTAACFVAWSVGSATVTSVETPVGDARLAELLADDTADRIGIDVPLGWPHAFVEALVSHQRGRPWGDAETNELTLRATDRWIWSELRQRPLSVSTDRIAYPAMRVARYLPPDTDRTGGGRVVEVYPAAALRRWGLDWKRYKRSTGRDVLRDLLAGLRREAPWLEAEDRWWALCERSDDAFDALVAALIARAHAVGECEAIPSESIELAKSEGWIALPKKGSLARLIH